MPRTKFLIAGGLIVAAITLLMWSGVNSSMVYYYSVAELHSQSDRLYDKGIRVSGQVAVNSIRLESSRSEVEFRILERATGQTLPVEYVGIIPDTFKDRAEVVVEGKYDSTDGIFHATTLLAKCPSKYEALYEESATEGKPAAETL